MSNRPSPPTEPPPEGPLTPDDRPRSSLEDGARGNAREPVQQLPPRQGTLPPPEWAAPRSVSGLALDWLAENAPVSRRWGARAELATLEAGLEAARAESADAERELSARLARALVAKGMELDRATK